MSRRTVSEIALKKTREDVSKRDAAIAKINQNEEFKKIFEEEREAYKQDNGRTVLFWHERGQQALRVKMSASYGQGAIDTLADAIMEDRTKVYKTAIIASMFDRIEDLQAKVDEAAARGLTITWMHLSAITHVPAQKTGEDIHAKRHQMLQLVIDHCLSGRATLEEVKERYSSSDPHSDDAAGASPPKSIGGILKYIGSTSDKAFIKLEDSIGTAVQRLGATTGDKLKDEHIEKLREDRESLLKLMTQAKQAVETFTRLETKLVKEKHKAGQAAVETPVPSRPTGRATTGSRRRGS